MNRNVVAKISVSINICDELSRFDITRNRNRSHGVARNVSNLSRSYRHEANDVCRVDSKPIYVSKLEDASWIDTAVLQELDTL